MAAIEAPPASDTLVSQPAREVMYASRRENLRLVMTPRYPVLGAQGQKTGIETKGITVKFTDGTIRLPLEGDIRTEHGHLYPAAEVIEWMERHHLNGDLHEGFFKIAQAAPPVSEQEFERILGLAMNYDSAGLRALLDAERAGWNRKEIVNSAEKALGQVQEFEAQVARQQAEQEKPATKRAAK